MSRIRYVGVKVSSDVAERFWLKVQNVKQRGCCWLWTGYAKPSGHGLTQFRGKMTHAHRVAWLLVRGEVPPELCVNHKCHNPLCCNPEHMYLGTRGENMQDRFGKRKYRVRKAVSEERQSSKCERA